MTPEERGAKAANECAHCEDGKLYLSDNFALTIAQHIREAVAEEREACAKMCDEVAYQIREQKDSETRKPRWD